MKTLSKTKIYQASPKEVFHVIDDLGVTGMHMMKSSMMMMGSKLHLEFITESKSGLNSAYRWTGRMLGMKMDFTVRVTKWMEGEEKIWETVGDTKLIIMSSYKMHLKVYPVATGTEALLSISYEQPASFFNKMLCFLFANWYCRWCLRKMLGDAAKSLEHSLHIQNGITEPAT